MYFINNANTLNKFKNINYDYDKINLLININ